MVRKPLLQGLGFCAASRKRLHHAIQLSRFRKRSAAFRPVVQIIQRAPPALPSCTANLYRWGRMECLVLNAPLFRFLTSPTAS